MKRQRSQQGRGPKRRRGQVTNGHANESRAVLTQEPIPLSSNDQGISITLSLSKDQETGITPPSFEDQQTANAPSSSQHRQQESIPPSSSQDQQQEDTTTAISAAEITPATTARISTSRLDDIHAHKPEPCGQPLAYAYTRGQLADALQFNKNHEGFLHTTGNVAKGMVLDAATSPHIMINDSVIITTIGGGREQDASGRMVRTKSQDQNSRQYRAVNNAFERKEPISVVFGSRNPSYPVKPPHPFCLLGFFMITYIWAEKTIAVDGSLVSEYMARLEKVDPGVESWWMPDRHETEPVSIGEFQCEGKSCPSCGQYSKTIYTAGWACLSMSCPRHFVFGSPVDPDALVYNQVFLLERHDNQAFLPLPPAIPALPEENKASYGTESEFKRGIVCPKCGLCSRRVHWRGWVCENKTAGCDYEYRAKFTNFPLSSVEGERKAMDSRRNVDFIDASIKHKKISEGGYSIEMFGFPNSEGLIGGAAAVLRATPKTCKLPNGPDSMFLEMQNKDLNLQRNPARAKGSRREELTSHFAFNYGAFYKFGVFVDSVGFEDAPGTILKGLAQLDWAQAIGIAHLSEFIRELPTAYSDKSMSLKSEKFNELLALGYFEKSRISYHDDGEKELGPTVATLSLGSPAVMRFRPKQKTTLGQAGSGKKGDKPAVISFALNHGDIVIMHGSDIHREYEHEVTPNGKLRFALTARFVRPESIKNPEERQQAVLNGKVPEGIGSMAYKGHEETAADAS
ncbi:hypothetical protein PG996_007072 [Apiospora saccharicola]|uniref:Fe2OG dioxygenase domain-containing protein n=1 Tax=Apiospora saccharicola TaxID=335842 RepID=A0ABR1V9S6_9PEZI